MSEQAAKAGAIKSLTTKPTIFLGVVEVAGAEIRRGLDELIEHINLQISFVDRIISCDSKNRRVLLKSGLISFGVRFRLQLTAMKYNAVTVVARKNMKHLYLIWGRKMTVKVRAHGKLFTVLLRHEYTPKTDELQTISDYRAKVMALCQQLVKLRHVCDIVLHFEK